MLGAAVSATEWSSKTNDSNGLLFTVSVATNETWENTIAVLSVTNLSEKAIDYSYSSLLRGFVFSMTDIQSKNVGLTDYGKKLLTADGQEETKYSKHTLDPESTLTLKIRLSDYFEPERKGQFNFIVRWDKDRLTPELNRRLEEKVSFIVGEINKKQ
jgi:hypothetical protein